MDEKNSHFVSLWLPDLNTHGMLFCWSSVVQYTMYHTSMVQCSIFSTLLYELQQIAFFQIDRQNIQKLSGILILNLIYLKITLTKPGVTANQPIPLFGGDN